MKNTRLSLIEVLSGHKAHIEKPIEYTDAQIKEELEARELNDKSSQQNRQMHLDDMFPGRTDGALYTNDNDMSADEAFELWLS